MKKLAKTILGCVLFSQVASAAATQKTEIVDVKSLLSEVNAVQKAGGDAKAAQKLVAAGERLMVPSGLTYANSLFNTALVYDPSNFKAQFYRRLLAPAMELQGFTRRISPVIMTHGSKQSQIDHQNSLKGISSTGSKEFALGGEGAGWKTERDIQKTMDRVVMQADLLRKFVRQNKNRDITFPYIKPTTYKRVWSTSIDYNADGKIRREEHTVDREYDFYQIMADCHVNQLDVGVFKIEACDRYTRDTVKVNRADWEMLQGFVAGLQMYFVTAAAYDLTGGIGVYAASANKPGKTTDREVVDIVKRYKSFGALRASNQLAVVPDLMSDLLGAAKVLKTMESQLCRPLLNAPPGYKDSTAMERPGQLFGNGVCLAYGDDNLFNKWVNRAELALSGAVTSLPMKSNITDQHEDVRVDITKISTNPPASLKPLLPSEFDSCGRVKKFADPTFGGFFVDGNGNEFVPSRYVFPNICN